MPVSKPELVLPGSGLPWVEYARARLRPWFLTERRRAEVRFVLCTQQRATAEEAEAEALRTRVAARRGCLPLMRDFLENNIYVRVMKKETEDVVDRGRSWS